MKSNCPFNYAGSKSTYPQLLQVNEPVIDLFGGGGGFWSNIPSTDIVVNDANRELVQFQQRVYESSQDDFEALICDLYSLTSTINNKDDYEALRAIYNDTKDDVLFYATLCCCTNNLIRYNKKGGFNQTWGKRKFNASTENKLRAFRERILTKNIEFHFGSWEDVPVYQDRLYFVDPPYLISEAGYNSTWTVDDEIRLYEFLKDKRFMLTNYLQRGETVNVYLEKFIQDLGLNVIDISQARKAQKSDVESKEVLINNI